MADDTTRDELLTRLQTRVTQLEATQARQRRRGHPPRRFLSLALVALLTALLPLSLLAANPFSDLVPGSVHNPNIDAIYNAGITTGCVPNAQYCPTDLVTRQEMASFLARTAGLGANPPVANAKTAQTADTATNATQLGGVPAANYVQTNNQRLPIAFATVNASGAKESGTTNVSVRRTSPGAYSVTIAGEDYFYSNYTAIVTLINAAGEVHTDSVGGNLLVFTSNSAGTPADRIFQFVVFKP